VLEKNAEAVKETEVLRLVFCVENSKRLFMTWVLFSSMLKKVIEIY
jgi:hypothetical protein